MIRQQPRAGGRSGTHSGLTRYRNHDNGREPRPNTAGFSCFRGLAEGRIAGTGGRPFARSSRGTVYWGGAFGAKKREARQITLRLDREAQFEAAIFIDCVMKKGCDHVTAHA